MAVANLKISTKLTMVFGLLLLVVCGFSGLVFHNINQIDEADVSNQHVAAVLDAAGRLGTAVIEQAAATRGFLLNQDPASVARFEAEGLVFDQAVLDLQGLVQLPEMRARLDKALALAGDWRRAVADKTLTLAAKPETLNEARALFNSGADGKGVDAFRDALRFFQDGEEAVQDERAALNDKAKSDARWTLGAGAALVALLSGLTGLLLARRIVRPIQSMTVAMRQLAEGDTSVSVPSQGRGDELGAMANAVQVFKEAAIENKRLEDEAAAARAAQDAQRTRQSAIDTAKAEDLRGFVHDVEESFQALAAGDLTARMHRAVAPEFEPIRATFNESVSRLEDAIASVVSSIGAIRTGLSEINVASGDLAQRTEQQAASLEETVAALSEVTTRVNETAAGAEQARAAAAASRRDAEAGGAVVERAVAAMSEIERSSQQINQIIGVIDEIAFQTNLLALNAGVEAARAGEAGKGFAVVASEVRGLAQRSAEAAKEIKGLISVSRDQVEAGVDLVSASGASLKGIVTQVSEMTQVVGTIASSAKEQAVSLKEVSTAADQMDKVTQQNAAMVEEATAAAQALSHETDALAQMIQRFRTKAASEMVPARGAVSALRPTSRPAAARPRVVQMRATHSAQPAVRAEEAGWEEF